MVQRESQFHLPYLLGIVFGFLGGLLSVHFLLLTIHEFRCNGDAQHIGAWYDKKDQIANSISGPKILFAGGSNVQYGIRAGLVEKSLGVPAVNYGTHAALPLSYILHRIKRVARPEDTVVLIPEYEYYFREPYELNKVSMNYLSVCDQAFLKQSLASYIKFLFKAPSDILLARFFVNYKNVSDQVRAKYDQTESLFDQYGDRNGISKNKMGYLQKRIIENTQSTSLAHATHEKYHPFLPENMLDRFIFWCSDNRVRLLIGYPNTIYFSDYDQQNAQQFLLFLDGFFKNKKIDVLMNPSATMLPQEDFFDTVYHLNEEGAMKRTEVIIPEIYKYKWSLIK